jgi:hypothetical protein
VLLCLKALCTTALALERLNEIQSSLFPVLIHMLFDEEKKGPSEFTTRNTVTSLLFTYLKSAPLPERPQRSRVLLSYLRDPEPKEEERPVGFVLDMRRERPFRVWNKEVVNVTKEVFWIFLHNLNIVALPTSPDSKSTMAGNSEQEAEAGILSISAAVSNSASFDAFNSHHLYMLKHFPQELPPVPAAPYVGGVGRHTLHRFTSRSYKRHPMQPRNQESEKHATRAASCKWLGEVYGLNLATLQREVLRWRPCWIEELGGSCC